MIRLLLVDDHDVVRMGLKQLFADRVDIEVTGEARTGQEAIDLVRKEAFDVALLDLSLSDMSGVDVLARVKSIRPEMAVLIVSGYPEDQFAISLLKGGASGFVAKDSPSESLVNAVQRFEKASFDREGARRNAERFSKERFLMEIKSMIQRRLMSRRNGRT